MDGQTYRIVISILRVSVLIHDKKRYALITVAMSVSVVVKYAN